MGFIYIIKNDINEMKYVGQTTRNVNIRFTEHKSCKTKNRLISDEIKKFGKINFSIMSVIEVENSCLTEQENFYINKYNTIYPNGYNVREEHCLSYTGSSIGGKSDIGHEKQSKKMKEKYNDNLKLKDLGDIPRGISYWSGKKGKYNYEGFKVRKKGIKMKEFISSKDKLKDNLIRAKNYLESQILNQEE
jgi:hypothetical protein